MKQRKVKRVSLSCFKPSSVSASRCEHSGWKIWLRFTKSLTSAAGFSLLPSTCHDSHQKKIMRVSLSITIRSQLSCGNAAQAYMLPSFSFGRSALKVYPELRGIRESLGCWLRVLNKLSVRLNSKASSRNSSQTLRRPKSVQLSSIVDTKARI